MPAESDVDVKPNSELLCPGGDEPSKRQRCHGQYGAAAGAAAADAVAGAEVADSYPDASAGASAGAAAGAESGAAADTPAGAPAGAATGSDLPASRDLRPAPWWERALGQHTPVSPLARKKACSPRKVKGGEVTYTPPLQQLTFQQRTAQLRQVQAQLAQQEAQRQQELLQQQALQAFRQQDRQQELLQQRSRQVWQRWQQEEKAQKAQEQQEQQEELHRQIDKSMLAATWQRRQQREEKAQRAQEQQEPQQQAHPPQTFSEFSEAAKAWTRKQGEEKAQEQQEPQQQAQAPKPVQPMPSVRTNQLQAYEEEQGRHQARQEARLVQLGGWEASGPERAVASAAQGVEGFLDQLRSVTHIAPQQLLSLVRLLDDAVREAFAPLSAADREAMCMRLRSVMPHKGHDIWHLSQHRPTLYEQCCVPEFGRSSAHLAMVVLVLIHCEAAPLFGQYFQPIAVVMMGLVAAAHAASMLAAQEAMRLILQPSVEKLGLAYELKMPTLARVHAAAVQTGDATINAAACAKREANAAILASRARALAAQVPLPP